MSTPETWLPVAEVAKASGISEKALRRRIERKTVRFDRSGGPVLVLLESVRSPRRPRSPGKSWSPDFPDLSEVLVRLETLAAENGRLRVLTEVAESTEQRMTAEIVQLRAELATVAARRRWWQRGDNSRH
jgi:hypothetical protein